MIRLARRAGPGALLSALGVDGVVQLRSACDMALAAATDDDHGHDPRVDPHPGDVLDLRSEYNPHPRRVVRRYEREGCGAQGARVVYRLDSAWPDRGREVDTALRRWQSWARDAEVRRYYWQPELCAAVLYDAGERRLTCRQASEVRIAVQRAYEASPLSVVDPDRDHYYSPYDHGVRFVTQLAPADLCVGCAENEAKGVCCEQAPREHMEACAREIVSTAARIWHTGLRRDALKYGPGEAAETLLRATYSLLPGGDDESC